jgi:23S rRNA pseudouridine1911/1915/1917 synthase
VTWTVAPEDEGAALAGFVRARAPGRSWREVKRWIATAKVFVDGAAILDEGARLAAGQAVEVRMAAPRRRADRPEVRIVHEDPQVVVIDKPAGVSSVPYHAREVGTAMDLLRDAWRRQGRPATRQPLFVVHRIDKDTSGLIAYAKTKRAERALAAQFRGHLVERTYLCVAHGRISLALTISSRLVADRGDGLRGSARRAGQGVPAVTHVRPVRPIGLATLCEVRLETGKTHQIRIHLAERGHPLVGETVYIRDLLRAGGTPLPSPRLLLHAATLGFAHPVTDERIALSSPLPADFAAAMAALGDVSR